MRRFLALVALMATMALGCSHGASHAGSPTTTMPIRLVSALQSTDSCGDLLGWIHTQARAHVGPYGLNDAVGYTESGRYNGVAPVISTPAPLSQNKAADSAGPSAAADSSQATTGTNDQEAGVDEPDQFKSDGHRAVMTDGQRLMSLDVSGPTPQKLGQLDLPMTGARLFLRGDHVLAVGQAADGPGNASGLVQLADIDLSAGTPRIAAQASVDGQLVDGRLANGTVRLVVSTPEPTRVAFVNPSISDGTSGTDYVQLNQQAIDRSTISQWIPSWTPPGGSPTPLEDCSQVFHPQQWAGAAMLSVLSISDGLSDLHPVGVVTDGQNIYASASALYVTTQEQPTQRWNDNTATILRPAPDATAIHRFDISTSGPAVYQGSGTVTGTVLDQYSMSELHGDLRVVSSTRTDRIVEPMPAPIDCGTGRMCPMETPATASGPVSSSPAGDTSTANDTSTTSTVPAGPEGTRLTVLRLQGNELTAVGQLDGLAPGEQVKTVRFVDNQAFIVTFRQYDPLFVVDVSDPASPKLLGQVQTPGFSAYLHPVGPNLLFGVGTTIGSDNEPAGSKVSLYDTSDPTHPTEVANIPIPGQGTTLDSDPHAFTWDAAHHLAFVSTVEQGQDGIEHDGMFVYRIDGHTITWVGFIDHSAHGGSGGATSTPSCGAGQFCPAIIGGTAAPANRVIVNGDQVLAASNNGVSARPVDTLVESAWVGW